MKKGGFVNSILSRMRKKGLSTVVISLIIILISLVAVGIIWVVVRNVIQTGTKEVTLGQFTLDAKIKDVNVYNLSNNVSLTLKRNPGVGEFSKMNFVFSDGRNSEVITQPVSLNELEEKWFMFHLSNLNVSSLISISIFPYIKQDEKEILGNILDKYTVSGQILTVPVCAPATCASLGYECGTNWANGTNCAGTLNCEPPNCTSRYGSGYNCNSAGRCFFGTCSPLVNNYCSTMGYECGYWGNSSCSGNLSCGTCGSQATCPSGTCVCNSGWSDCNNDNTCECDLSSNYCSGVSCVVNTSNVLCGPSRTFYIDFVSGSDSNNGTCSNSAWKRAPGMTGFSGSYTHRAGDRFIFKGGVTWDSSTLPLIISYSGNVTNYDNYTIDQTWYSGGSWTNPVFDMRNTSTTGINILNKVYVIINGFRLINPAEGALYYDEMIFMDTVNNLKIQNCNLDANGGIAAGCIYIRNSFNVTIENSYLRAKGGLWDTILTRPWNRLDNIIIRNNTITHGSYIGSTPGNDGIHQDWEFGTSAPQGVHDILIENNTFFDQYAKSHIAILGGCINCIIRYNSFFGLTEAPQAIEFDEAGEGHYYSNVSFNYNLIWKMRPKSGSWLNWGGDVRAVDTSKYTNSTMCYMRNNVIWDDGNYSDSNRDYQRGIFLFYNSSNWKIENNIIVGLKTGIEVSAASLGAIISNNSFFNNSANGVTGTNAIFSNPLFVDAVNNNFKLQAASPCINKGIDWGQTRDIIGTTKQGSAWDIGAYEYV